MNKEEKDCTEFEVVQRKHYWKVVGRKSVKVKFIDNREREDEGIANSGDGEGCSREDATDKR